MRKLGIIGYPLGHSFSPNYFSSKFTDLGIEDATYVAYPIENIDAVKGLLEDLDGFNVTTPYKEQIIAFLDHLDPISESIGAVNCVKIIDGIATGYNTDYYGFRSSLEQWTSNLPEKALILGSGGAAKAVQKVLSDMHIEYLTVSRSRGDLKYEDIDKDVMSEYKLIINTTPLGMAPMLDQSPSIPYFYLNRDFFLYDLIYNPYKTLFLTHGELHGAQIKNGHEMLVLQAEKSWEIWNK